MVWTTLLIMLALAQFVFFGIKVGQARGRYGVAAPATSGHPDFDRYYRVHANTLEQLVVLVPSAIAFAHFVGDIWAAAAVAVYLIGRIIYFLSYIKDPASRGLGFLLTFLPSVVMVVGTIVAVVLVL